LYFGFGLFCEIVRFSEVVRIHLRTGSALRCGVLLFIFDSLVKIGDRHRRKIYDVEVSGIPPWTAPYGRRLCHPCNIEL